MSVAAKMPLIKIEIKGKKRKLYLVSEKNAQAVEALLRELDEANSEGSIPSTELFPDLGDPAKTPGIALKGVRLRLNLTQKEMAKKIGVTQGDLSKMEKGERPIGKTLAMRIGEALGIDYHRFL